MKHLKVLAILAVTALCLLTIAAQAYPVNPYARVYEGIEYATGYTTSPQLMRAFAAKISLQNPDVWVYASHDNGGAPYDTALQNTTDFVADHGLKVAVNTCFFNPDLSPNTDILGLLISNGVVVSPADWGAEAQMCFDSTKVASLVTRSFTPTGIYNACGTGNMLLVNGVNQGPGSDLQPRTALGLSQDNKFLIFVCVDGRQSGWSDGATWYDMGQWLIDFGAYNGAMYDGGGSTCLTLAGYGNYMNSPCYGYARPVGANLGAGSTAVNSLGPDAAARDANRVDVAYRGNGNGVYVKTWTSGGGWAAPVNIGGGTVRSPAICAWDTNRVSAFAVGSSNQLYVNTWNGTSWSGWNTLGGLCTSGPAACSWGAGRIDVFIAGYNNELFTKSYANGVWSANWLGLGGSCTSDPAACSMASGRLDVFVRSNSNVLYQKTYSNGAWAANWVSLGGSYTTAPAACSWGANRMDIFARGTDNALWHRCYNGAWQGWESIGGTVYGDPSACSRGSQQFDVFVRGTGEHLYQRNYSVANGWGDYYDLGSFF